MQTIYWSRSPGKLVNKYSGVEIKTLKENEYDVLDWYNTLSESITDCVNNFYKQKLSNPNYNKDEWCYFVTSKKILSILEYCYVYRPLLDEQEEFVGTVYHSSVGIKIIPSKENTIDLLSTLTDELVGKIIILDCDII
jgi:hypothetical protein